MSEKVKIPEKDKNVSTVDVRMNAATVRKRKFDNIFIPFNFNLTFTSFLTKNEF